jgi:hypothetical protein
VKNGIWTDSIQVPCSIKFQAGFDLGMRDFGAPYLMVSRQSAKCSAAGLIEFPLLWSKKALTPAKGETSPG